MLYTISYENDGTRTEEQVDAPDLETAFAVAQERGEFAAAALVEDGPGEGATPTADPFVQQSPNGTLWRWTVSNSGTGKWVKI